MPKQDRCTICKLQTDDLVHLDLPVRGSEGIGVCGVCQGMLTNIALTLEQRCAAIFTRGWDAGRKTVSGPRKHRTLVRVVDLGLDQVTFALHGFRNFKQAVVDLADLSQEVRRAIQHPPSGTVVTRFHVWANLEAEKEEDIGFENWQVG